MEENHGYSDIVGSSQAPYMNSLITLGVSFSNMHAVSHPSEPNYFAIFSGDTQGITDDGDYNESGPSLAGEIIAKGKTFVGYAEPPVMRKHCPWESFSDSQGVEQPFTAFPTDFTKLPALAIVTPNQDNDMHDGTIQAADAWLQTNIGAYATWAKTHNSLLIVTWDEAEDNDPTNQVLTIYFGANLNPGRYTENINHYNNLSTIEAIFKLNALGQSANAPAITDVWGEFAAR